MRLGEGIDGPAGLRVDTSSDGRVILIGPDREDHIDIEAREAGWLFRVAGPLVLIALRDAQQNAEPRRGKR